jgi:rfaE bifunctional protein nucleotidyltransferase chain/domain
VRAGGKVVFTNGVFDILHPGHIRYLQDARKTRRRADLGINSDRSVGANKGPERPITRKPSAPRSCRRWRLVDAVGIFDEETPRGNHQAIEPDVLVKGADWGPDNIVGRDTVESRGGRVVRMDLSPGYSTRSLIRKVMSGS